MLVPGMPVDSYDRSITMTYVGACPTCSAAHLFSSTQSDNLTRGPGEPVIHHPGKDGEGCRDSFAHTTTAVHRTPVIAPVDAMGLSVEEYVEQCCATDSPEDATYYYACGLITYLRRAGEQVFLVNAGDDLALVFLNWPDADGGEPFSVSLIVGYITQPTHLWFEEGTIGDGRRLEAPTLTTADSFAKVTSAIRAVRGRYVQGG